MQIHNLKREERAIFALRGLYEQFGYARFKMSRFEEYELYVRNKDFLVSDEVITFTDRSGRLLALKPDVTLSIIKNTAQWPGNVQKVYYNENVYRVDGGTHTFKEIMQTGLECVGELGDYEVAEVLLLALKSLSMLGDSYLLDISHMGLIAAVLDGSGLSGEGRRRALDFLRQKNSHELAALCGSEPVSAEAAKKLQTLVSCPAEPESALGAIGAVLTAEAEKAAFRELRQLCEILSGCGFADSIRLDFSVGNDLKYYSGVVFKGYLAGIPASVLSGGQYDRLLRKMGRKGKAIGFAVYVDLLERLVEPRTAYDIGTVLLHDGSESPAVLFAAAQESASKGSVLVATELPEGKTWHRLIEIKNGEAVLREDNG